MKVTTSAVERPQLVTIPAECRRTGLPRSTVYELVASQAIPSVRIGRSVYLPSDALDSYIAAQAAAARAGLGG